MGTFVHKIKTKKRKEKKELLGNIQAWSAAKENPNARHFKPFNKRSYTNIQFTIVPPSFKIIKVEIAQDLCAKTLKEVCSYLV